MPNITIYTTPYCPYCVRAKDLFDKLTLKYTTIDVSENESLREEMIKKSGGRRTVPQIFFDDQHIGGYDDLYALYKSKGLEAYFILPGGAAPRTPAGG
jgi:glutaredoxin 3